MHLTLLMMNRMGMQDAFDVLAFWAVFDFDASVEKDIVHQEISAAVHSNPNTKE